MTLQTPACVHAIHDIHQGPYVVKHGWHGMIVHSFPAWSGYTVEFVPEDVPGTAVTLCGLTEADVQPD